ncbi:MAG TPA: hypothetical protein PLB10_08900 [Thiolinea sp.]|nr:hypothetical protein [Thiolinea sp.]
MIASMFTNRYFKFVASLAFIALSSQAVLAEEDMLYIAGTRPAERPAQAPVITSVSKDGAWYQNALQGVDQPYPHSLRFLEDQGNWFSPFTHPGMDSPYDLRHWHTKP